MTIQIFAMDIKGQDFRSGRWDRYLSEERRAAAGRIRQEEARQLFLGAEALMNRSLEYAGASAELPAAYTRNSYGKPYLTDRSDLYVNWSHSGHLAVCALSDQEVGIDVQDAQKEPGEALICRVLQPEEHIFYEQMPKEQRKQLFYEYWTVKESYLKALGTGFRTPLDTFYVQMGNRCPKIIPRDQKRQYTCRLLNFGEEDYAAAVCVRGVHPDMEENIPVIYIGWKNEASDAESEPSPAGVLEEQARNLD